MKKLSKELHPDKGGSEEEFNEMMDEYTELIDSIEHPNKFLTPEYAALASSLAGILKVHKPDTYKKVKAVVDMSPFILNLLPDSKRKNEVQNFLGNIKLND